MYKITITKTEVQTQNGGKEWKVVSRRLVTEDDLKTSAYNSRDLTQKVLAANVIMFDEMGYTPVIEKEVEVERMIYEQTVDDLNMTAVIKAINKIESIDTTRIA